MAATMSMEAILDRVQDLKMENEEKDEVIRVQQGQIHDLETKVLEFEERCVELEQKITEMAEASSKADAMVEKLSQMLG